MQAVEGSTARTLAHCPRDVDLDATAEDWPAIWSFMRKIVAAEETFPYDQGHGRGPGGARCGSPTPRGAPWSGSIRRHRLGLGRDGSDYGGSGAHVASASFMVDPVHWGKGAGRALSERALEWARSEGYRAMQFHGVAESITRAVAVYRSLGFEVLAPIPEGFRHATEGYVGLHVMYRPL
jgi:GNAT superfamily N-acetyltransferase